MKRSPHKVTKTVTLLTDPRPVFNSIVGSGANGTPLRVIKSEDIEQETTMPKTLKNGTADIACLVFRGEKFKSETEVQAWLDAGNYTDTVIKAEDDGAFTVAGDASIADAKEIEVEDGVSAFVGETGTADATAKADVTAIEGVKTESPKTGAQKTEDDEMLNGSNILPAMVELTATKSVQLGTVVARAHKDSTLSAKEWNGLQQPTRDKLLDKAIVSLKAEAEAEPEAPAAEVVQPVATVEPVAEVEKGEAPAKPSDEVPALLAKAEDGVISLVAKKGCYEINELSEIIRSLSWLKEGLAYDAYTGNGSAAVAESMRGAIKALGEILIQVTTDTVALASKTEEPAAVIEPVPAATPEAQVEASATAEEPAPVASKSDDTATTAILDAIKTLSEKVEGLGAEVKSVKEQHQQSATKAEQLAERLTQVENTSQTRKSADVEDIARVSPIHHAPQVATKSAAEISAEVRHKSSMEAMGIRT